MSLAEKLTETRQGMATQIPDDAMALMHEAIETLRQSGLADRAIKTGDRAPGFDLPELAGDRVQLSDALQNGSVVVTFYRGAWCPYCNLEMLALQQALSDIEQAGGRLLAITPELPEHADQTREQCGITFSLLHDRDNSVAKEYGLVFTLPEKLRPVYEGFGIDLVASQGNTRFELPLPATYIIRSDGVVAHAFVDVDYTKRCEPEEIIEVLKSL